jgi:hypothetical protein
MTLRSNIERTCGEGQKPVLSSAQGLMGVARGVPSQPLPRAWPFGRAQDAGPRYPWLFLTQCIYWNSAGAN